MMDSKIASEFVRAYKRKLPGKKKKPTTTAPHFGVAQSLDRSRLLPRDIADDLYLDLPEPIAFGTGHVASSD